MRGHGLAHNLEIQLENYSPQIVRYQLRALYGAYDPVLTLSASNSFTKYPPTFEAQKLKQSNPGQRLNGDLLLFTTNIFGHDFQFENNVESLGPSLTGLLPPGLSYNLFARSDHFRGKSFVDPSLLAFQTDAETKATIPPATNNPETNNYYATAGVTLRQPVLRDSWIDLYRRNIQLRKKDLGISELALRAAVMTNVTKVATVLLRADLCPRTNQRGNGRIGVGQTPAR